MIKLDRFEKEALRQIEDGADVLELGLARTLRSIEERYPELLKIGMYQGDYDPAKDRLPYFGAMLTAEGKKHLGIAKSTKK